MSFDIHVIVRYWPDLLHGAMLTLLCLFGVFLISGLIGVAVCMGSLSRNKLISVPSRWYVHILRVAPDIVTVFWVYYCVPPLFGLRISGLGCGIIALSLTSGAYFAEVIRAGVQSVPLGQTEAAISLGMKHWQGWFLVVLPQAVRNMLPALINTFTDLLKHTSLLAGIGVGELTYQAYTLGAQTFRYVEFLTVVGVAYFIIIFPLSLYARLLGGAKDHSRLTVLTS